MSHRDNRKSATGAGPSINYRLANLCVRAHILYIIYTDVTEFLGETVGTLPSEG